MKLYFAPFACSLASHIALRESGLLHELIRVDLKSKTLADGNDFYAINPNGQVPTLLLDRGQILSEGPAVLQFIADQAPVIGLAPKWGSFERYELIRWLNIIGSELHKAVYWPIFNPTSPPEAKAFASEIAPRKFKAIAEHLAGRDVLVGNSFTVVDAYLLWALAIAPFAKVDLSPWPALAAYAARHHQRPAVAAAFGHERALMAS